MSPLCCISPSFSPFPLRNACLHQKLGMRGEPGHSSEQRKLGMRGGVVGLLFGFRWCLLVASVLFVRFGCWAFGGRIYYVVGPFWLVCFGAFWLVTADSLVLVG